MDHVHQRQRDEVVLDGGVLVGLSRHRDFCKFITVGLVDGRGLHSHVEPNVFAALEENWGVGEDARVVGGKVQVCCPVHRNTGDVQTVRVGHQVLRPGC